MGLDEQDDLCIDTIDPRGFRVVCTKDWWVRHIVDRHPNMQGLENLVEEAIQNPMAGYIFGDKEHENRHVYYYRMKTKKHQNLKVVVQFAEDEGMVITAFPTARMKPGEYVIWKSSNP